MDLTDFYRIVIDPDCIPTEVAQSFHVVEDAVVGLACRGDARAELEQIIRDLLRVSAVLEEEAPPEDYMAHPLCRFGRVVGLIRVVEFAIARSHPPSVVQLLRNEGGLALLSRLGQGRSVDVLVGWLGWDRATFNQRLARLEAFGLVIVRLHHEHERWIMPTILGRQALRDLDE